MAKLRFPGRPGHRFDRLSLKYFADDIKNAQDPSLAFLPQFQRGLKSFRDIVGHSDEVIFLRTCIGFQNGRHRLYVTVGFNKIMTHVCYLFEEIQFKAYSKYVRSVRFIETFTLLRLLN